jgi:hypothetical protein
MAADRSLLPDTDRPEHFKSRGPVFRPNGKKAWLCAAGIHGQMEQLPSTHAWDDYRCVRCGHVYRRHHDYAGY